MANNPKDDRPRNRSPRRDASGDHRSRQPRQGGGGGGGGGAARQGQPQGRSGRMSREEVEWARDLWRHREPPDEIAQQLGVSIAEIEALIAGWQGRQGGGGGGGGGGSSGGNTSGGNSTAGGGGGEQQGG